MRKLRPQALVRILNDWWRLHRLRWWWGWRRRCRAGISRAGGGIARLGWGLGLLAAAPCRPDIRGRGGETPLWKRSISVRARDGVGRHLAELPARLRPDKPLDPILLCHASVSVHTRLLEIANTNRRGTTERYTRARTVYRSLSQKRTPSIFCFTASR